MNCRCVCVIVCLCVRLNIHTDCRSFSFQIIPNNNNFDLLAERYAEHWCSLLTSPNSTFTRCHAMIDPDMYHKVSYY